MSDVKALDPALLKQYSTDFNADRANLVAANAAVSVSYTHLDVYKRQRERRGHRAVGFVQLPDEPQCHVQIVQQFRP